MYLGELRAQLETYEEGWPGPEGQLWIVVNRFVSEKLLQGGKQGGITMTFMHGSGLHKEVSIISGINALINHLSRRGKKHYALLFVCTLDSMKWWTKSGCWIQSTMATAR
jgi:hypothetical protein